MSGSAVGFSFQGDVIGIGQAAGLLTGRILKALSDGGVDPYAVLSLVEIGNQLPISAWVQKKVRDSVLAKCQSRTWQSVLIQALKIGWDHSPVAMEMTRSKGGTSALVLVEALSECSGSLEAAATLEEFLLIGGASRERIPNVDVTSGAIGYLRCFVGDSGFSGAFRAIVTCCKENWMRSLSTTTGIAAPSSPEDLERSLTRRLQAFGDPKVVAGAMNQLMLTCKREESINFIGGQRVAWLAAFACHVLGMSGTILYNETVLWETRTKSGGHATFQIGTFQNSGLALERVGGSIHLVEASEIDKDQTAPMEPSYRLGDVVDAQLAELPQLSAEQCDSVRRAIVVVSRGFNPVPEAIEQALGWMSIPQSVFQEAASEQLGSWEQKGWTTEFFASDYFYACGAYSQLQSLRGGGVSDTCKSKFWDHRAGKGRPSCLCWRVALLIETCASLAADLSRVSVPDDFPIADIQIAVRNYSELILNMPPLYGSPSGPRGGNPSWLLTALSSALGDRDARSRLGTQAPLGITTGVHSLVVTAVMTKNSASRNKHISLLSGRISLNNCLRTEIRGDRPKSVLSMPSYADADTWINSGGATQLAEGYTLMPHGAPFAGKMSMEASLRPDCVHVTTLFTSCNGPVRKMEFCLEEAIGMWIRLSQCRPECGHDPSMPYTVKTRQNLVIVHDGPRQEDRRELSGQTDDERSLVSEGRPIWIYALKGEDHYIDRLLIALCSGKQAIIQESACLKCCIEQAPPPSVIIMA